MSDLSTFVHGALFVALFPALIFLMLLLDRIWPSNAERQQRAQQERRVRQPST